MIVAARDRLAQLDGQVEAQALVAAALDGGADTGAGVGAATRSVGVVESRRTA